MALANRAEELSAYRRVYVATNRAQEHRLVPKFRKRTPRRLLASENRLDQAQGQVMPDLAHQATLEGRDIVGGSRFARFEQFSPLIH
jgi:hypothetical protein